MAFLGVKGVLEMILSHRAPSSLNMSPYRAIWTHFRPNSMTFTKKNVLVLDQALAQDQVQDLAQTFFDENHRI